MARPVILPMFNMDMTEGVLLRWIAAEGAAVREGEPLCEIETDKVNMEVEAPASGILAGVRYPEGATIPVTSVIAYIASDAADAASVSGTPAVDEPSASSTAVQPAEVSSAPVVTAAPVAAPVALAAAPAAVASTPVAVAVPVAPDDPHLTGHRRRATPAVRRVAREHGIALVDISDQHGRVTMQAVLDAVAALPTNAASTVTGASASAPAAPVPVDQAPARALRSGPIAPARKSEIITGDGRRPLEGTRRRIAERMVVAHAAPHITLVREVQVPELMRIRKALAPSAPSITVLIAAATIRALLVHPEVNSTFEDGYVVGHRDVNLGIAVARPEGLIVPVVRDAQHLSIPQLAEEMKRLSEAARVGRLSMAEISDGTFTITSLGQAGIDMFSPLVNPPQVAILGVGRLADRVVPLPNGIGIVPTMYLSLTCDHRVIDGAPGADFLATLARDLEAPDWLWAAGPEAER